MPASNGMFAGVRAANASAASPPRTVDPARAQPHDARRTKKALTHPSATSARCVSAPPAVAQALRPRAASEPAASAGCVSARAPGSRGRQARVPAPPRARARAASVACRALATAASPPASRAGTTKCARRREDECAMRRRARWRHAAGARAQSAKGCSESVAQRIDSAHDMSVHYGPDKRRDAHCSSRSACASSAAWNSARHPCGAGRNLCGAPARTARNIPIRLRQRLRR
jgi:hypothetical protein